MSRIAFLGTPGAAVPTLLALVDRHDVAVVITQPDRPVGRSKRPVGSPVKEEALRLGLTVRHPTNNTEMVQALESVDGLDLAVVVAYGRLLTTEALSVPTHGMLNVHFSLLPRWRGAAPVARALWAGDPMTGVTIIVLDEGLDTGPVLTAQAIDIEPEQTNGELTSRLADMGARLLASVLAGYVRGEIQPVPQTNDGMTYAAKVEVSERPLPVEAVVKDVVNRVRALSPEPGATLRIDDETLQIRRARPSAISPRPGTWQTHLGSPVAGFADGGVELVEIQPPGKKPMSGAAWIRGLRRSSGSIG